MTKLHKEQLLLGRYLWERIDATENTDLEGLKALVSLTFNLMEVYEGQYVGYMWDLCVWIGLKRDAPDAFEDYGISTRKGNPEYFAESIRPPKITIDMAKVDSKLHPEQLMLGRYLWERVKVTDYTNTQALDALGKITWHLQEAFEGKYYGFMWHLNMWIGLKPDVHDNWDKFGEGFRQDNPEYFEGVTVNTKEV